MPRFSVVVPAYNAHTTLSETLDAMAAQLFEDWECVIVDDGSTDDTAEIAQAYADRDPRMRVISQENRGTGGAYNTGVRSARGEWISICSADDILLPQHLSTMSRVIDTRPEIEIISCNGYYLLSDDSREIVYGERVEGVQRSWSLEDVFDRCFFSVGACYRRSLYERVGGYPEDVFGEDYEFWLQAMVLGAHHLYIPDALSLHRISATQKSANVIRAYESDIRSIEHIRASGTLTSAQQRAAKSAIAYRRRLISERMSPNRPANRVRSLLRRLRNGR